MSAEGRQILRRTVGERQWTLAERLAYMDCMRTLGWRCEGTRWVSTVHRAPVCVFILTPPPPPRPLTTACRLKRSQSAYRAFHQELWKTLQIFDMPKTLREPLRSPTTPDDHQRPTTVIWRPSSDLHVHPAFCPLFINVRQFFPERCSETGSLPQPQANVTRSLGIPRKQHGSVSACSLRHRVDLKTNTVPV